MTQSSDALAAELEAALEDEDLQDPKRRKTDHPAAVHPPQCTHPGFYGGVCIACGEPKVSGAAPSVNFKYIHRALELTSDEAHRVR